MDLLPNETRVGRRTQLNGATILFSGSCLVKMQEFAPGFVGSLFSPKVKSTSPNERKFLMRRLLIIVLLASHDYPSKKVLDTRRTKLMLGSGIGWHTLFHPAPERRAGDNS